MRHGTFPFFFLNKKLKNYKEVTLSFVLKLFPKKISRHYVLFYLIQLFYKTYIKMVLNFGYISVKNSFEKLPFDYFLFLLR